MLLFVISARSSITVGGQRSKGQHPVFSLETGTLPSITAYSIREQRSIARGQGVLPQTPLCSTGTYSFQVYVQILHVVDMPLDTLGPISLTPCVWQGSAGVK